MITTGSWKTPLGSWKGLKFILGKALVSLYDDCLGDKREDYQNCSYHMHTDMSGSCGCTVLGLGLGFLCFCVSTKYSLFVFLYTSSLLLFGCQYQCN